jgi:hypothetical protein
MTIPLDLDVKKMTPAQLRQEVMRLRTAFRKELNDTGDRRCWITLLEALPEGKKIQPLRFSRRKFRGHCDRYYDRNQ